MRNVMLRSSMLGRVALGLALALGGGTARAQGSMAVAHAPEDNGAATVVDSGTRFDSAQSRDIVLASLESQGTSVHTGYAAAIVQRPLVEVLAALHDVDHYADYIPQFEQSHELSRAATTQEWFVRIAIRPIAHLWARIRYHEVTLAHGAIEIEGHALAGNVERMDVRWRATPVGGGTATVVEFWSLVLPALPVPLPASVLDGEEQSAARRGIEAVRARVEHVEHAEHAS